MHHLTRYFFLLYRKRLPVDYAHRVAESSTVFKRPAMISSTESLSTNVVGEPRKRVRQWHHKTKSGCSSCKFRRIRCPQEKPTCSRCIAAGRECSYGVQPKAWLFETAKEALPVSTTALTVAKPSHYASSSPEEARALQFYLEVTVPAATIYKDYTKDFFAYIIPQVAQTEAAIRHLAVAVATKQEIMSSSNEKAAALSLVQRKHYLASLAALCRGKTKSEEVMLLASALFMILGQFEPQRNRRLRAVFI